MEISKDKVVTIDYSLRDAAGKLLDASGKGDPLVYLHGNDNLIPGLEKQLDGKKPGDRVVCVVAPSEAYGVRDESLVLKVQRKDFGEGAHIEPGMQFEAHGEGGVQVVTVVGIDGDEVTIDANHPLAGEELHFDVNVVDIRDASEEELHHGHVHSHGGCSSCGDGECDCEGDCDCDSEDEEGGCSGGCCC